MDESVEEKPELITVQLHRVNVNMGDHAETVVIHLDISDDATIRELMEKAISASTRWTEREWENQVVLQFAKPIKQDKELPFP